MARSSKVAEATATLGFEGKLWNAAELEARQNRCGRRSDSTQIPPGQFRTGSRVPRDCNAGSAVPNAQNFKTKSISISNNNSSSMQVRNII